DQVPREEHPAQAQRLQPRGGDVALPEAVAEARRRQLSRRLLGLAAPAAHLEARGLAEEVGRGHADLDDGPGPQALGDELEEVRLAAHELGGAAALLASRPGAAQLDLAAVRDVADAEPVRERAAVAAAEPAEVHAGGDRGELRVGS